MTKNQESRERPDHWNDQEHLKWWLLRWSLGLDPWSLLIPEEEKLVQRQQGITIAACEAPAPTCRQDAGPPPFGRRPGAVPVRGTLNRSQCLLELARKLTGAARVGVGLISADGQFAEHLATG